MQDGSGSRMREYFLRCREGTRYWGYLRPKEHLIRAESICEHDIAAFAEQKSIVNSEPVEKGLVQLTGLAQVVTDFRIRLRTSNALPPVGLVPCLLLLFCEDAMFDRIAKINSTEGSFGEVLCHNAAVRLENSRLDNFA
jgi:hypothetical protein